MAMDGASASNALKSGDALIAVEAQDAWRWPGTATMNTLHRARFLDQLIRFVPQGVATFNKQLVDVKMVSEGEGGGVRLRFADGTEALADAVVGYDGIKSKTRDALMKLQGKNPVVPQDAGMYAYRDLMDIKLPRRFLGLR